MREREQYKNFSAFLCLVELFRLSKLAETPASEVGVIMWNFDWTRLVFYEQVSVIVNNELILTQLELQNKNKHIHSQTLKRPAGEILVSPKLCVGNIVHLQFDLQPIISELIKLN